MKTKDFIKMLQEIDPSGELHIRLNDGFPYYVEKKEGYWDGPYSFLDKNNNFIITTEKDKIDIWTMNIKEFIKYNIDNGFNWKQIKKKIKFKTYGVKEKEKKLKKFKKIYNSYKESENIIYEQQLNDMIDNGKKGWTWFQNKNIDNNNIPNMDIYYTWKIYDNKGIKQGSCMYNTEPIFKSGYWIKLDNNKKAGYYEWKFKK